MSLSISKRHAQMLALLCLLLGSVLFSRPISAAGSPPRFKDEMAGNQVEMCKPTLYLARTGSDGFHSGDGTEYVLAALKKKGEDWMGYDKARLVMSLKSGDEKFARDEDEAMDKMIEGVPLDQKARVVLKNSTTAFLLYYGREGDLNLQQFTFNSTAEALTLVKETKVLAENYMDDRNTPLWDIIYGEQGFYTPNGCFSLESSGETSGQCRRDCFTIDHYCIFDPALNVTLDYEQSPNLEGGPREYYDGIRYNSLFCNTFSMSKAKDGKRVLVVRNSNKNISEGNPPDCYEDEQGDYHQAQFYSLFWDKPLKTNRSIVPKDAYKDHCLDLNGTDLGLPVNARRPMPTPNTPLPQNGSTDHPNGPCDSTIWPFTVLVLIIDILMTALLLAVVYAYFKWKGKVAGSALDVGSAYTYDSQYDDVE